MTASPMPPIADMKDCTGAASPSMASCTWWQPATRPSIDAPCPLPIDENDVAAALLEMQRHANSHDSCPEDDYIPAPAHLSRSLVHDCAEFGHLALITLTGLFFPRRLGARSAPQTLAATSG
jgi:hypothetical protein